MWRSLVSGSITRKMKNTTTCVIQSAWWIPAALSAGIRLLSGYPTKDHTSKLGRPTTEIRAASVSRPVAPISARTSRIQPSSGLVFVRSRSGRCP